MKPTISRDIQYGNGHSIMIRYDLFPRRISNARSVVFGVKRGTIHLMQNFILLYKVQCFLWISGTGKTDNLTCEIIYDNFTLLVGRKPVVYIINRKIHGCLEIPDLFRVLNMIFLSFAALTRQISCSTLEINLVFPRTHVLFSI